MPRSLCRALPPVFGLILLFGLLSAAAASNNAAPDWVRAAMAQTQPTYPPETSAVVLLDEQTLTVGADGRGVEHRRFVMKILRPQGRDEGVVVVRFTRDTKILGLHVWSVGPDGHEYTVKDSDFREFGYGEGNLYADDRFKVIEAPGRDPGGVVAYELEQRAAPYVHEANWFFQGDIPHLQQSFTLELPPGFIYRATWAHHDEARPIDLEHGRTRWEMNGTPAIDLDRVAMHPALEAIAGRLTVDYAAPGDRLAIGTWKGIGEWYEPLEHDRVQASPELAAKAAELTAGKADFYEKTEAISEWVQRDIRYFAIELGIGGQQPHPAADIFRNRYGDCKDKATLLTAMLSSVGVHAALMMVDSERGVIDPLAPSIVGNHMIAAIEIPKGYESPRLRSVVTSKVGRRYLIFDPTWEKTAYGQLEHNLQGGFGVLMEGPGTEIVELPVLDPALNRVKRTGTFQLGADGSLTGSVVESRFGDLSEAARYLETHSDEKAQRVAMEHRLSRDFGSFQVADVKTENAELLNKDFTTRYQLTADRFARQTGPLLMVRPRVLGQDGFELDRKPRLLPIDLRETMQGTDDFTIELPPGYAIDEMPEPVKLDLGFAAYESTSQMSGNALHYTRTYTVRQVSLPAARYADLQRLAGTIEADEASRAVLRKK